MAKKVEFKLDKKGIGELIADQQIAQNVADEVGSQFEALFEKLYPGSKWKTKVRKSGKRAGIAIYTDDREVPFREAYSGRIRKTLRNKLKPTESLAKSRSKRKKK